MWHYDQQEALRTNRKRSKPPKKGQSECALYDYGDNISLAVFSSLQGEPHNHQIAALAIDLKQAMSPVFKVYIQQVKANAVALGNHLMSKGYKLVTDADGTKNHLVPRDFHPLWLFFFENMRGMYFIKQKSLEFKPKPPVIPRLPRYSPGGFS